jgi:acetyltransferase
MGMGGTDLHAAALETSATLADGTIVALRPLHPEDEPLLHDIARHMSPEDLRLRFFMPVATLSHAVAARLTRLDDHREMAIIALADGGQTALGVVRFAAEPGNHRAEFAIGIRSDWQRRGLGRVLMLRLMEIAQGFGIVELFGDVMGENAPMLALARRLGFAVAFHPDDRRILRVMRTLG